MDQKKHEHHDKEYKILVVGKKMWKGHNIERRKRRENQ